MADALVHALAFEDTVRIVAAVSTETVGTLLQTHDTSPTATAALGRLTTAAALMGATLKDGARLSLQVEGGGPLGMLLARATDSGEVYGTVAHPHADVPPRPDGKLDVGAAVGDRGMLLVSRDLGFGEPYVGMVPLTSGEIGDDIAGYFLQSEQIRSAVGVGVLVTPDRAVAGAGGFLLQLLGGVPEDAIEALEARLSSIRDLSREIEGGLDHDALLERLTGGDHRVVARRPLRHACPFDRTYYADRLRSLGETSLDELFGDEPSIDVTCEFTRATYAFTRAELLSD